MRSTDFTNTAHEELFIESHSIVRFLLFGPPPCVCYSSDLKAAAPPMDRRRVSSHLVSSLSVSNSPAQVNTLGHTHTESYKQGCGLMSHPQVSFATPFMSGERGDTEVLEGDRGSERNQFGQCQPFHLQLT